MKFSSVVPLLLGSVHVALAQAPSPATGPAVTKVIGEIVAVDVAAGHFSVRADSGETIEAATGSGTACLRAVPGTQDLASAAPVPCGEIAVGDRVFVRGSGATSGQPLAARQVILMTRSDLSQKRERERAEWQRRGVGGVLKAVDPATGELTLEIRSFLVARELVVTTADRKAILRRYAAGSTRFADAKPCALADLKIGDQVRALGDRAADGSRFLAEQVVAGAFRTVVGTVEALRPADQEIVIKDLATKQKLVVLVQPRTRLRRLPPDVAARFVARRAGIGGPGNAAGPQWPRREGGAQNGRAQNGPSSLADLLERFPSITMGDLTTGEAVAVALTEGNDARGARATTLLAGVEPLVTEQGPREGREETPGLAQGALDLGMGISEQGL
jgi:hypothetical protein